MSPTGWRRCIRSLKLQISFRKRTTNYRAVLREMTSKDKVSYDSTPPCTCHHKSPILMRALYWWSTTSMPRAFNWHWIISWMLWALRVFTKRALYTIKRGLQISKRGMNFIRAALYPVRRRVFLVDCDALSHWCLCLCVCGCVCVWFSFMMVCSSIADSWCWVYEFVCQWCVHAFMYCLYICIYIRTCICTWTYREIDRYMYICICIYVLSVFIYIYTYMHMYMNI